MQHTIKIAFLFMLLTLIISPVYALPLPQENDARAAFELLLKADAVYDRAIGIAGTRPKEYDALETLRKAGKIGKDYALKLVWAGAPAARVYGAILLLELDKEAAEREFPRLEEEATTVKIQLGCIGGQATIGDLARQLKAGKLVIMTPTGTGVRHK